MSEDTYFKHFTGPYTPMEDKLIDAIRSLERRVSILEQEQKRRGIYHQSKR